MSIKSNTVLTSVLVLCALGIVSCLTVAPAKPERVLIVLAPENHDELQLTILTARLTELGIGYDIAVPGGAAARITGGIEVPADLDIQKADPGLYASLFIAGGPGARTLYDDRELARLCVGFDRLGKLIAALEYAPPVLAAAGVLNDGPATCWPEVADELRLRRVEYAGGLVAEAGTVLTGLGGSDKNDTAFIRRYLERLAAYYASTGRRLPKPGAEIPLRIRDGGTRFVMSHNGLTRTGLIHVPENYDASTPFSLVIVLHGQAGTAADMVPRGFNEIAAEFGFIVVYPDGYQGNWDIIPGGSRSIDDEGFFGELIDGLRNRFRIDPSRVYLAGHSMGGFMAHRLAYDLPGRFAAVASSSGLFYLPQAGEPEARPVSVMHLHARDDRNVPFTGDPVNKSLVSAPGCAAFWSELNGADREETFTIDSRGTTLTRWSNPDNGTDVELIVYPDGGHTWQPSTTELVAGFFYNHPAREGSVRIDLDSIPAYHAVGTPLVIPAVTGGPGKVRKVVFMSNGELIGEDTEEPFVFTWNDPERGTYRLTAEAVLESGAVVRSTNNGSISVTAPDLARGCPVTVSSTETETLAGANAVDGDPLTRWASAYADPQWIEIDLGQEAAVSGVTLLWEAAYASAYELQVSRDGTDWVTVHTETEGKGGTEFIGFAPIRARHFRLYGTARATRWGYSLWDILVH